MSKPWLHYEEWEDWHAGQYAMPAQHPMDQHTVDLCAHLLSDTVDLYRAMMQVTLDWPQSTAENLYDPSINRRAWLGQAACCLRVGAPAFMTKQAWWMLSPFQRGQANRVADRVIGEWERLEDAETLFG